MRSPAVSPASAADLPALAALASARSATRWDLASLSGELNRPDALLLVAREGGAVVGYAAARLVGAECRLLDFTSASDGSGTGRALWAALVAAARGRAAARLTLEVSAANARARAFYERAGARVVGRRKKFYDDGSDALLMDHDLA